MTAGQSIIEFNTLNTQWSRPSLF